MKKLLLLFFIAIVAPLVAGKEIPGFVSPQTAYELCKESIELVRPEDFSKSLPHLNREDLNRVISYWHGYEQRKGTLLDMVSDEIGEALNEDKIALIQMKCSLEGYGARCSSD